MQNEFQNADTKTNPKTIKDRIDTNVDRLKLIQAKTEIGSLRIKELFGLSNG